MFNCKFLPAAVVALALWATPGFAADLVQPMPEPEAVPPQYATGNWYLRGDVGWSFLDWSGGKDDNAFNFGGGVGYQFSPVFRADVRADHTLKYDTGAADLTTTSVLANGYFDMNYWGAIKPYIGAGIGWGWADLSPGSNDDGLAYAAMAGVSFDLSPSLTLDTGYRFRGINVSGPNVYDHTISTGLRFKF